MDSTWVDNGQGRYGLLPDHRGFHALGSISRNSSGVAAIGQSVACLKELSTQVIPRGVDPWPHDPVRLLLRGNLPNWAIGQRLANSEDRDSTC
jgi:hypothetical protein